MAKEPQKKSAHTMTIPTYVVWLAGIVTALAIVCAILAWYVLLVKPTAVPVVRVMEPITSSSPATTEATSTAEVTFDACGPLANYRGQLWFADLEAAFLQTEGVPLSSLDADATMPAAEGCFSEVGRMFVFQKATGYGRASQVWRFDTVSNQLAQATFDGGGEQFHASALGFGSRDGSVIHMEPAVTGDAGECATFSYDYDFTTNVFSFVRSTPGC